MKKSSKLSLQKSTNGKKMQSSFTKEEMEKRNELEIEYNMMYAQELVISHIESEING